MNRHCQWELYSLGAICEKRTVDEKFLDLTSDAMNDEFYFDCFFKQLLC